MPPLLFSFCLHCPASKLCMVEGCQIYLTERLTAPQDLSVLQRTCFLLWKRTCNTHAIATTDTHSLAHSHAASSQSSRLCQRLFEQGRIGEMLLIFCTDGLLLQSFVIASHRPCDNTVSAHTVTLYRCRC